MENFKIAVLIAGSLFILFGYLRFITDDNGNVNLNNYRFTGGSPLVILGMVDGTRDLGRVDLYGLNLFNLGAI
ncbi:MetJ regulator of methionine regulon [Pseudoalteromonas arctica]|uniref:MetJ regulator of methionine regulon n=1 Tax=Pseudoalteromonas arctica TaxID=394751 RepID=A0ABU9TB34_9GAMM